MTTARGYGRAWQVLCAEGYRVYGYRCHAPRCLAVEEGLPGGRAIDPDLPHNDRWSKTMGHRDALALVGRDVEVGIEDVRPEHRACNASQGTQLRIQQQAVKAQQSRPRSREW